MQMRKHFDWFIPRQTEDFMSYGCCGMGQAYKPSGLHCRGVNSICGRQAKYSKKLRQCEQSLENVFSDNGICHLSGFADSHIMFYKSGIF